MLATVSRTTARRTSSARQRMSKVKLAAPAMTLEAPGQTVRVPTVHTSACSLVNPAVAVAADALRTLHRKNCDIVGLTVNKTTTLNQFEARELLVVAYRLLTRGSHQRSREDSAAE